MVAVAEELISRYSHYPRLRVQLLDDEAEGAWSQEQHLQAIRLFLAGGSTLFAYKEDDQRVLSPSLPPSDTVTAAAYFIKLQPDAELTPANISSAVHSGLLDTASALEALQGLVGALSATQLQQCPDNVKHDFQGQLQRVMADLTEAVHAAHGQTRLFVPSDPLDNAAVADKARTHAVCPCPWSSELKPATLAFRTWCSAWRACCCTGRARSRACWGRRTRGAAARAPWRRSPSGAGAATTSPASTRSWTRQVKGPSCSVY